MKRKYEILSMSLDLCDSCHNKVNLPTVEAKQSLTDSVIEPSIEEGGHMEICGNPINDSVIEEVKEYLKPICELAVLTSKDRYSKARDIFNKLEQRKKPEPPKVVQFVENLCKDLMIFNAGHDLSPEILNQVGKIEDELDREFPASTKKEN